MPRANSRIGLNHRLLVFLIALPVFTLSLFALTYLSPAWAQETPIIDNTRNESVPLSAASGDPSLTNNEPSKQVKAKLHQELNQLLEENLRINRERKSLLENAEQKTFWMQCLILVLALVMIASVFSFWRFHAKRIFRQGLDELSGTLRSFQDSLISFIDTTQIDAASSIAQFHPSVNPASKRKHTTAPIKPQDTPPSLKTNSAVAEQATAEPAPTITSHSFIDGWIRAYQPNGNFTAQAQNALKNRPNSPGAWLHLMQNFRQQNDYFHFESLRAEIKKFFNIRLQAWDETEAPQAQSIADFPHVQQKILELWHSEEISTFIERLLLNSRLSAREGFDPTLYQHLENLLALAKDAQRPATINQLKLHPVAQFLFIQADTMATPPATNRLAEPSTQPAPQKTIVPQSQAEAPLSAPALAPTPGLRTPTRPVQAKASEVANEQTPKPIETKKAAPQDNRELNTTSSISAYEVRLKLALAYQDIGDLEGACLLLEEVILDGAPDQRQHAQSLLRAIEQKRAKLHS